MAIPASYIVSITPRVISAGGTDLEFNGLFLTTNKLVPLSAVALSFVDADSVGDYFGLLSNEYAVASIYFKGYTGSFAKPKRVFFARRVDSAVGAYIRGGKFTGTLADIKSVLLGELNIEIDGNSIALSSVDFSGATSLSDAATILQTALQAELASTTVEYSSVTGGFIINSPTTGNTSTITYGTGNIAELLNFGSDKAVLSQGSAMLSVDDNMALIKEATQNFVAYTTVYSASNDEYLALCAWANAQEIEYLYAGWTNDAQLTVPGSTTSIADLVKTAEYGAQEILYNNVNLAAFLLGAIASVDRSRTNGSINFAFKKVEGVAATVTDQATADLLLEKGVSFMGSFATRNDQFTFFYDAKMYGTYGYVDAFINTVWFKNVMQVAIMNGLTNAGRVPYNEAGYSLVRSWLQDPINRAINNGVIDTGVTLSESQKTQIIQETGKDISMELSTVGYAVLITDAGASSRVGRQSPNISVYYTYAGSVHRVEVASTAIV